MNTLSVVFHDYGKYQCDECHCNECRGAAHYYNRRINYDPKSFITFFTASSKLGRPWYDSINLFTIFFIISFTNFIIF
jgi:hypothetical protein